MILKKLIISLSFLCFLNGCAQNVAFLGPVITGVSTGSIHQAGLSYGSSQAIKKITGKTATENIKNFIDDHKKIDDVENDEQYFLSVRSKIKKKSKIQDLTNQ